MNYEVLVSDIGTVYQGADYLKAERIYEDYSRRSSASYSRISKKQVMLIEGTMSILKKHNASGRAETEGWSSNDVFSIFRAQTRND